MMIRSKLDKIKSEFRKMGYQIITHLEDEPLPAGGRRWSITFNISKPYGNYMYIRSFYIQSENYPDVPIFGRFVFHPSASIERIVETVAFEFSQFPFGVRDFWYPIPSTDTDTENQLSGSLKNTITDKRW